MTRAGRPRDPALDGRIITAATGVLAADRHLDVDAIAAYARVGKASIYRRWPTLDALLVDVVADLGIRDLTVGTLGSGDTREDLLNLLTAASTGTRALAEAAVLPRIGLDVRLRRAYSDGPFTRLEAAIDVAAARAEQIRGEWPWPSLAPVFAGVAILQLQIQTTGLPPDDEDIEQVLDQVILPALGIAVVTA